MYRYYLSLSPNENGVYVVHILFCKEGAKTVKEADRATLGFHLSCRTAVEMARGKYKEFTVMGCPACCPDCV